MHLFIPNLPFQHLRINGYNYRTQAHQNST